MAKTLHELGWVEDLLPENTIRKPMFGGLAYYLEQKLILCLFEDDSTRSYKNKKFDFALWNGCLFPADRENHPELFKKFPFLINHPVLPKWLYLPLETEDFESLAQQVLREIRKGSPLLGTIPKPKKSKKLATKNKTLPKQKVDTRQPKMFANESKRKKR